MLLKTSCGRKLIISKVLVIAKVNVPQSKLILIKVLIEEIV